MYINSKIYESKKISTFADKLPYALAKEIIKESPHTLTESIFLSLNQKLPPDARLYLSKELGKITPELFSSLQKECIKKTKKINTSIEALSRIELLAAAGYLSDKQPWLHELEDIDTTSILATRAHLINKIDTKPITSIIQSTKLNIIDLDSNFTQLVLKKLDHFDSSYNIVSRKITQTEYLQLVIAIPSKSKNLNEIIKIFLLEYDKVLKEHAKVNKLLHQKETRFPEKIERILRDHCIPLSPLAASAICNSPNKQAIVADLKKFIKTEQKRICRQNESSTYKQRTVEVPHEELSFIAKWKHQSVTQVMTEVYEEFIKTSVSQRKHKHIKPLQLDDEIRHKPEKKLKSINFKITLQLNEKLETARKKLNTSFKDLSCILIHKEYELIKSYLEQLDKAQLPSELNLTQNHDWSESLSPSTANSDRFK